MFSKQAYQRFELPRRLAEAIAGWDEPLMVSPAQASHMRSDDYVIGLVFRGTARAYPLWVIDNYHVVNDRFGEERVVVTSCERCQTGAAFLPEVPGRSDREPLFRSAGVYNATLTLTDLRSGTLWNHYEGRGLRGRAEGVVLPWLPTYHMEWSDWLELHPDSEVMAPPEDLRHPDARHGHGREEYFARPGVDPAFVPTIVGPLDDRYPENEMVLAVEGSAGWTAYPLNEVKRAGGVVHAKDGDDLVVLAGPARDGFTMAAFESSSEGRELRFSIIDGRLTDNQTSTQWTIEGVAVEGPLVGSRLIPRKSFFLRWHAWFYSHRDTKLFRPAASAGEEPHGSGRFAPLLDNLRKAGREVRVLGPPVSQLRPRRSVESLSLAVDDRRLNLHFFTSEEAARDYDHLGGAYSALPLTGISGRSRTLRRRRLVLQADPPRRFVDPAQVVPLADELIEWAPLDAIAAEAGDLDLEGDGELPANSFADVLRGLRANGLEVIGPGFLPPGQLRVGCADGIGLMLDGHWFLLYLFENAASAQAYATMEQYSLCEGPFVLRSAPDTMYLHLAYEIAYANDHTIRWSPLIDDVSVKRALADAIEKGMK